MKKHSFWTIGFSAVLVASTLTTGSTATAQPAPQGGGAAADALPQGPSFSAASIEPDLAAGLAGKGIMVKQPSPKLPKKGAHKPTHPQPLPRATLEAVQNNLALLVKFPEENGRSPVPGSPDERMPASYFNDLLYGTSYDPYALPQFARYKVAPDGTPAPTDRTLRNYFHDVSYGKIDVRTYDSPEEVGWITAPHPYSYYFGNTGSMPSSPNDDNAHGFGNYPHNVQGLVEDVVKAADPYLDFSKYALDGVVPGLFIIHEGSGAEWNLDPQAIWSHMWNFEEVSTDGVNWGPHDVIVDGVRISKYSMEPELGGNLSGFNSVTNTYDPALKADPIPPSVGVYAHEFGHVLGLPDLYDYGYESEGVGAWSVMAGGSWARYPNYPAYSGNTPVGIDAWSKYFTGLVDAREVPLAAANTVTLPSVSKEPAVYKVTVPKTGGSEYFLFENRQLHGWDLGLARYGGVTKGQFNDKMHGLLVYHVDDNVLHRNFWRPNEGQNANPNRTAKNPVDVSTNEWHYGVGLVQADGQFALEQGLSTGDAGDVYPGIANRTELIFSKSFYSGSYYNHAPLFGVRNITEANGVISAQFFPVP